MNMNIPVRSSEVSWFDTKLRNRGLTFGVIVACNGITGNATSKTAAHSIIANALHEQRNIIVITRADIQNLKKINQVVKLFKEKLCELAITGTIFP